MGTWTLQSSSMDGSGLSDAVSVWSETLGLFVVLSDQGPDYCLTSPDGINWTGHGNPFSPKVPNGLYGKIGLNDTAPLLVTGTNNGVYTSSDGSTWVHRTSVLDTHRVSDVVYSPELSLWVAVGSGYNPNTYVVITSSDGGITWLPQSTPWDGTNYKGANGITWSPDQGLFVVVGGSGGTGLHIVMTSSDGVNWSDSPTLTTWDSTGLPYQVIWSWELFTFIASGGDALNDHCIMQSINGTTWTNNATDPYVPPQRAKYGECLALLDIGGTIWTAGYTSTTTNVFSSTDLSTWIDEMCPLDANTYSLAYSPSLLRLLVTGIQVSGPEIFATQDFTPPVYYQLVSFN